MSDEVITPEVEEPDDLLENSEDDEDRQADDEFAKEQLEMSQAVQDSAHELEQLAAIQLTGSLGAELGAAAAVPASNPLEIITRPPAPGSRLEGLRTQLEIQAKGGGGGPARARLLTAMLGGVDVTEGLDPIPARDAATALLTHLVYAAKGAPLPELAASPAAQTVIDMGGKLATMSDASFWRMFADAADRTIATPDALKTEIAMLGMAHEMQPLKTPFTWPTADAVTLQVDELVAAATIDPDYVDLDGLYRRAEKLSLNGQPIPRAVTTELVRLALADLITRAKFQAAADRVPSSRDIADLLKSESGTDAAAKARNIVRTLATKLMTTVPGGAGVGGGADPRLIEVRASRGHLAECFSHALARVREVTAGMKGGAPSAAALDTAVAKSGLLPALQAWSEAYRNGETDPAKLNGLLRIVTDAGKALTNEFASRFPMQNLADKGPAGNAVTFQAFASFVLSEVALETAELLRTPPSNSSDPFAGPSKSVEHSTTLSRARTAATDAAAKGRLSTFLDANLPKSLRGESWAAKLIGATTAWGTAETRDAAQVIKAASAFADALSSAHDDLQKNWTPGEVFVGDGLIDALSTALTAKLEALAATDPQIKAGLTDELSTLRSLNITPQAITDLADYWQTTSKSAKGLSKTGPGLSGTLKAWDAAAANPGDSDTLVTATYRLADALTAKRTAIAGSSMTDADKAITLRALDDLGNAVATRLAALAPSGT